MTELTVVTTQEEKNGRIALLGANLLTLVAISCGSLGVWRVGTDLDWAGDFVVRNGLMSHWQVWIGTAAVMQYTSWWLARYAAITRRTKLQPSLPDARIEPKREA